MYLRDVLASCLRRWPFLLLAVALSAGVLGYAFTLVGPEYEGKASVVLVPPVSKEFPDQNRYLGLGGLKQTADVLARSMTSSETVDAIEDTSPNAEYEVLPDWATSAPILTVSTKSSDPEVAQRTLDAVLARLPVNLRRLQDSVDIKPSNQITQVMVNQDTDPETVQKTRIRILGLLTVILIVGSVLVVGALDGLLLRRSQPSQDELALSLTQSPSEEPTPPSPRAVPPTDRQRNGTPRGNEPRSRATGEPRSNRANNKGARSSGPQHPKPKDPRTDRDR